MIIPQSIVATSLFREVKQAKAKSSRPWTKNKRDTSAKYLENTAYRRTTFSKKSKGIKKYADDFAQQTGAEIKIVIYNPDNKKTQTYYTKNVSVPFGRESKHSTVEKSAAAAPPPPLVHSPFKGLNLPINFHNYLLSSSSGAALLPIASTVTASSLKTIIKRPIRKTKPISNNRFSNACTKTIICCLVNNDIITDSK